MRLAFAAAPLLLVDWLRPVRHAEPVACTFGGDRDVHIVGDIYLDMIAQVASLPEWDGDTTIGAPIETKAGGSALNTAAQLSALVGTRRLDVERARRFGLGRCVLHSCIGSDLYGDMVVQHISQTDVVLSAPKVGGQGVCICLSGARDRAFVSYKGSVESFCAEHIDTELLFSPRVAHVHFAAYYDCEGLQPAIPELLGEARARGLTTSLVPQSAQGTEHATERLWSLLPLVDVLICNKREASSMAGLRYGEHLAAVDLLLDKGSEGGREMLVVVTLGQKGAIAKRSGCEEWWRQPSVAREGDEVVDTTGAGDAFAAGFLYGWCGSGDVALGLRYGCACGAAAVGQTGGSEPLTPEAIQQSMPELRAERVDLVAFAQSGAPPAPPAPPAAPVADSSGEMSQEVSGMLKGRIRQQVRRLERLVNWQPFGSRGARG